MVTINRKLALVILVVLLVGMGLVVVNMMRDGGGVGDSVRGLVSEDKTDAMSVVERAKARRARELARRQALEAGQETAEAQKAEQAAPEAKAPAVSPAPKAAKARPAQVRQSVEQKPAPQAQAPAPRPAPAGAANTLERVEVIGIDNGAVLRIVTSKPVESYKYFSLKSPNRVVVDLYGGWSGTRIPAPAANAWISNIRTGIHPDKLRIVADIAVEAPGPVSVRQNSPTELVVTLRK